jgi:hypothetical protein
MVTAERSASIDKTSFDLLSHQLSINIGALNIRFLVFCVLNRESIQKLNINRL